MIQINQYEERLCRESHLEMSMQHVRLLPGHRVVTIAGNAQIHDARGSLQSEPWNKCEQEDQKIIS